MKKYLLALVALLVVATGCGNTKKLECSTEIQGLHQDVVAEYDGEEIIHIVSMDGAEKAVALEGEWVDLISKSKYSDTIALSAYEPVLLVATEESETPETPDTPDVPEDSDFLTDVVISDSSV